MRARRGRPAGGTQRLKFGDTVVDLEQRIARQGDEDVHLTSIEIRLLAALAKNAPMVVTRRQLLTEVWEPTDERDTHYLACT